MSDGNDPHGNPISTARPLVAAQSARPVRQRPLFITATRIGNHLERYHDLLDGRERDALALAIQILDELDAHLER